MSIISFTDESGKVVGSIVANVSTLDIKGDIEASANLFIKNNFIAINVAVSKTVYTFVYNSMILGSFFFDDSGLLQYRGKVTERMQKFVLRVNNHYNKDKK